MTNVKVLVTGGTGYIGSHTLIDLIEQGFEPISVDNGINSNADVLQRVKEITGVEVKHHVVDLTDLDVLEKVFESDEFAGVIHFAALKAVGESVAKPLGYYRNNIFGMINVLDCCVKFGVKNFIFSSSCTVYGNADVIPVDENAPIKPAESPYGKTKQIGEDIMRDVAKVSNLKTIALRYFNPAGAHPSGILGEAPSNPAMNLVPIITETAIGKRNSFQVFGTDYPTRDGSCIRDYIHIMDLAKAHTLALKYLIEAKQSESFDAYNLGFGEGVTVLEAIDAFERVSGVKLNYTLGGRRAGDVVAIFADFRKAKRNLGWTSEYTLDDIMSTAWEWEQNRTKIE